MTTVLSDPVVVSSYVDGGWAGPGAGVVYQSVNPTYPDQVVAEAHCADPTVLERGIEAAHRSARAWARTPGSQRGRILSRAAELLEQRALDIGSDMAREMGKTLAESVGEVGRAAQVLRYYGGQALEPDGETYPATAHGTLLFARRVPLGVVAVISPWNFPIAIPAWKIAPALAYGNTVVWKPAELTPLTSVHLVQALVDAGLPAGVLNLILGAGRVVGQPLAEDPRVDGLTFTGSNATGAILRDLATRSGKRVQLELGGSNPAIVLADANLEFAAASIARAAFLTAGQKCTATSRVFVEASVSVRFAALLAAEADAMVVGDPLDPAVGMGPLASADQYATICQYLKIGRDQGRQITTRSEADFGDNLIPPVIFVDLPPDSPLLHEEVFGPVVALQVEADYAHCVAAANAVSFGLSASLYTADLARALQFADDSDTGLVKVNQETSGVEFVAPFGGTKDSGFGPQEQGKAAREFFTHWKTVYIDQAR